MHGALGQVQLSGKVHDPALRALDVAIDVTRRYDAELTAVSIAYSPAHAETAADPGESSDAAHHGGMQSARYDGFQRR